MKPHLPCAIYTRKSSEEGLEQDFNSLHAQREACEAFIQSQKAEGWKALPEQYDDGGFSGGNMERPALKQLMADIAAGKVRIVVVYKVDRLTRSLADFAKLVEQFDAQGVSFVSVTQQFNTTSSMGRLTLNVLLSFAQFEREVTGERIRDKIAASKKKGMWMGGFVPMGYRSHERTLIIDDAQAERIRTVFRRYLHLGSVKALKAELDHMGWVTPTSEGKDQRATGGKRFSRGHLYRILSNPIYLGRIAHKGQIYPGNHPAIIDQELWGQVQARLAENRQTTNRRAHARSPILLVGLVFDAVSGEHLTPTHAAKGSRRYRYYVSHSLVGNSRPEDDPGKGLRIPAQELEGAVVKMLKELLTSPADVVEDLHLDVEHHQALVANARRQADAIDSATEHERIQVVSALIERVTVSRERLEVTVKRAALLDADLAVSLPLIVRAIPVQYRRSGFGIRMIIPSSGSAVVRRADPHLLTLIHRGTKWFRRLVKEGCGPSSIAEEEKVSPALVQRMIYTAFLAPDIVKLIEAGDQPATLTSRTLMDALPLPPDWAEQRILFGIQASP